MARGDKTTRKSVQAALKPSSNGVEGSTTEAGRVLNGQTLVAGQANALPSTPYARNFSVRLDPFPAETVQGTDAEAAYTAFAAKHGILATDVPATIYEL
jgi:hypothetical protein